MSTLRDYQQVQIKLIRESFSKGNKRIILCSPTGSGKSLVMAEMVRLSYEKGKRTIILTHRKELFKSTLQHISNQNIPCAELSAGSNIPMGDWKNLITMEKTLWNRIKKDPKTILIPDLIIADEMHFNNFTKIINHFDNSFIIGFTATPKGKHISKLYTDIIDNVDIPKLIASGYLTPCKPFMMKDPEGFDKIKKKGDDFDTSALFNHYNKANPYQGVLDEYLSRCKGMKGMIFCVNVEHTIKTWEIFKQSGVNAFLCHSKMSDGERDYNVREFESSNDGVMINCGILTTGYSHDPIRFIFVDRATTSLPLWLQMQGRGSRKHKGKDYFIVCDFGDNHTRLGLWNQPRQWSLSPPKRNARIQAAAIKTCPSCGAMLAAASRKCEFCNYEFPKPTHDLLDGVMVECDTNIPLGLPGKRISELSLTDIANLQRTKKYKASYCWRIVRARGSEAIREYAKLMDYKNGWVFSQNLKMDDSKFSDYVVR